MTNTLLFSSSETIDDETEGTDLVMMITGLTTVGTAGYARVKDDISNHDPQALIGTELHSQDITNPDFPVAWWKDTGMALADVPDVFIVGLGYSTPRRDTDYDWQGEAFWMLKQPIEDNESFTVGTTGVTYDLLNSVHIPHAHKEGANPVLLGRGDVSEVEHLIVKWIGRDGNVNPGARPFAVFEIDYG